ncbi:hypothetical protein JT096_02225, partial [Helicobacter pylori]|nr:hypothetical protein [Helicobacter pylori]
MGTTKFRRFSFTKIITRKRTAKPFYKISSETKKQQKTKTKKKKKKQEKKTQEDKKRTREVNHHQK